MIAPKEISFLDAKRSQSINIMLKAVKIDPATITRAILTVNLTSLPRFVLTELLKLVPSEDEILKAKQYEKEEIKLASAEKFIYEVSEIPRYEETLKAMLFKSSFPEFEEDGEKMISVLEKSCKELQNCPKFQGLLKIILALGNYLNGGQKGGAYGFKLNSLLKVLKILTLADNF